MNWLTFIISLGYLQAFCQTLLDELDRLPGDARTQIGFIAFDRSLYYFNLGEGLSQPQLLVVSDIEGMFGMNTIQLVH